MAPPKETTPQHESIPSASMPNRFDHATAQQRLLEFWEANGYHHNVPNPQQQPFSIVIPPPNVTGALHLGHALNNTLQDILVRCKRMQGFNTLWMPGTDHAGIATQAVVERRLREEEGKTRHDLGRQKLVDRIWAWKAQYETRILGQLKQMGCSCDWQRTRFTLDDVCARAVRRTFFDLFRKQRIYRGKRLVNWDTFLQTAVSDDELFHETVQGFFWHFRYPVIDPQPGEPTHVTIATTRPETMLGDTAVAVHPDPRTALEQVAAEIRAKLTNAPAKDKDDLQRSLEEIEERRTSLLPQLEQLRDMARAGRQLLLPLLDRPIPLVADPWAKPELGSGCVKITPAHDPNDYEVGLRCQLPMINILNADGTLNAQAGPYQGQTIAAARKQVVADLDRLGLLVQVEDREIDLAHSDRSKTPIEPYLANQWFVRMAELAQSAIDAVTSERVRIFPPRYAKGYLDWLGEKRDWPVSRQLWWGHQIPVWTQTCDHAEALEQVVDALRRHPALATGQLAYQVDQPSADRPDTTADGPYATIHVCIADQAEAVEAQIESLGFQREEDVLDTWFSSALWPHSTLGWPEQTAELAYYYPTSTLITSRDIITLWVARMVLTGLNNMGEVPFREVFIHPKILDGYGETMSKSKGNGVDPLDVIEKFSADALRFGLSYLTMDTQDVRMPVQFECPHCDTLVDQTRENREQPRIRCQKCRGEFSTQWATKPADKELPRGAVVSERFELARNFCNKLWNAARFSLMNLEDYQAGPIAENNLTVEDRWILSRLATVTQSVTQGLDEYRYGEVTRTLYDFAWNDFCSFYVEMAKPKLQDPATRVNAQRVLAHTLDTLLRLLHPIIPFITEEIWQMLGQLAPTRGLPTPQPASQGLMVASWPQQQATGQDPQIESQFQQFQAVLGAVRELRSRQGIPPKTEVEFRVQCEARVASLLEPMLGYFSSMARARCVALGPQVTSFSTAAQLGLPGGVEVFVNLAGIMDVEAETQRNEQQLHKLVQMIQSKERQLSNAAFVDRAPPQVVQRERDQLAEMRDQLSNVEATLNRLRKGTI